MNTISQNGKIDVNNFLDSIGKSVQGVMFTYEIGSDGKRKLISLSDSLENIVGKQVFEALRADLDRFLEFVHPDDLDLAVSERKKLREHGIDIDCELRLRVVDGSYRWMRLLGSNCKIDNRIIVTGAIVDIHAVRSEFVNLLDSESKFRSLLQYSNDAMYVIRQGRIIMVNNKFTDLIGYDEEDIKDEDFTILSFVAPRSKNFIENRIQRYREKKSIPATFEFTALTKDGREIVLEASVSRVTLNGEEVSHIIVRDITSRVQQSNELAKLYSAVEQSENLIVITNLAGIVEYVNPHFTKITGYLPEDIIGKDISMMNSGLTSKETYRELWKTICSGKSWSGKLQNKRKNGELYWENKTITPVMNQRGEITNYLSVASDITNELRTQEKLIESDKISAIGTLAAGVAHEFKNYLGGIIGNASLLLDDVSNGTIEPDYIKDTLSEIIGMGDRANDVAMSLLTFSKAKPEDRKKENIHKIVHNSLKLVEKDLESVGIETITHFEDVPDIELSACKIQQILLNLLINAKHAIKQDGVVTVAVFNKNDIVEIRIGDSGGGIQKDLLKRIFDPFFSTKGVWGEDNVVGTGMGLAISRNLAREHHGELTVSSIEGLGTTFILSLPVSADGSQSSVPVILEMEKRLMIFSLDKMIFTHYYPTACEINVQLVTADNINNVPGDIAKSVDLVVCDAKFSGKIELYRMVERCHRYCIPYCIVNSGAMEYQLNELYHDSFKNFKSLPELTTIIELYNQLSVESIEEQ